MAIRIIDVKPLPDFRLFVKYNNGVQGEIDLSGLAGKGVFSRFNEPGFFESVQVGENGAPTWDNEVDIDPINPYLIITGKSIEEFSGDEKNFTANAIN